MPMVILPEIQALTAKRGVQQVRRSDYLVNTHDGKTI